MIGAVHTMLHGILAALLLFGIQAGAKSHLAFKIEVPKNEYVVGEPIMIRETLENTGNAPGAIAFDLIPESPVIKVVAKGTLRQECMHEWPSVKWISLAHRTIAVEERIEREVQADWFGITDEGDYEVWVVYDTTSLSSDWAGVGVALETVESNHENFSIRRAQGDDQAALAQYGDKCNRVRVDSREWSDRLMRDFPNSTYASWIALRRLFGPDSRRWRASKPWLVLEDTSPSAAEAPALLGIVRSALAKKPETSVVDLKFGEVILLWRMNKKQEAVSRLKELSSDLDPIVAKQARRFLEATETLSK
jgi:hypothetical protein